MSRKKNRKKNFRENEKRTRINFNKKHSNVQRRIRSIIYEANYKIYYYLYFNNNSVA